MELKILEKNEFNLTFQISDISIEMINALRRIMMSWIPCFAVDEVIILKNDSTLYDDILAHRIGLIPLKTDLEAYNLPEDCECGGTGCPQCQVSLTCEIQNDSNDILTIYSGDLETNDPNIVPTSPNIPIAEIGKDSGLTFEAYAILGRAKDHVKWQSVSNVFYRKKPIIEFDDSKCKGCPDKCIVSRMCPEKLFEYSDNSSPTLKKDAWQKCTLCKSCEDNCPNDAVTIGSEDNAYIFYIESDGVLTFKTIIEKTFEILDDNIVEFSEKLETVEIE
ncbi:MAG: DNA-directed RNA polymerase subunit D [Promethearchaeota archaeon]|nr:MAG: DNA-directed RNA polymerase subunit D [Candidatus Lokiarchaeota archaeon]